MSHNVGTNDLDEMQVVKLAQVSNLLNGLSLGEIPVTEDSFTGKKDSFAFNALHDCSTRTAQNILDSKYLV
jgi:hypothetical protein